MARRASSPVSSAVMPGTSTEVSGRPFALSLLISLRPGQWTKNLLVFAGLLFGLRLNDPVAIARSTAAFVIFCALSGVVYLVNDVSDRENDRHHPHKSTRPIASGALSVRAAILSAVIIGVLALGSAFALGVQFFAISAAYLTLQVLYSGPLKHMVILDVLTIAIGFVMRAVAGAIVVDVDISHWLLVCTILLALFISLAKRRHELVLLASGAVGHRPILGEYSPYLLDQMISVVTASTLISYIFYTISPETELKFGTHWLGLTIPFPLYGIFRYLYLVHQRDGGGSPADMLLTDRPLLTCVTLWALFVALLIYRPF
jgi:4-hydroxybenzoate polyprenyltransferase